MAGRLLTIICAIAVAAASGCDQGEEEQPKMSEIGKKLESYATVRIEVPWESLSENETRVLENLYLASKVMDEAFLLQVSESNPDILAAIEEEGDEELLRFFKINFGPWDRLDNDRPFYGKKAKPDGAAFYPEDMTREEFEDWITLHPDEADAFESGFTVIRRDGDGGLKAVPYSERYSELLKKSAAYMREAAGITENESLARFLRLRADAYFSDDYYESDMAWMDVRDNLVDITIGPYEVYEDNLFNYKTAFEAFLCVRDPEESAKLEKLKSYLVRMEKNLPIEDRYKDLDRGTESPVSVVDEVFAAGDTKAGVQTLAFNLPNDERVRQAKGSKKVMLRNICHAKFDKILMPIAERVVAPEQLPLVTFDAYFNHILLHEFSHGLGPGEIVLEDGTETTVNKALKEAYSAIEEAKADVVGEYNFYYLIGEGVFPREMEKQAAVSFLAGFFRSVRFGVDEAHGRANMMAFNYLKEKGVYEQYPDGLWKVNFEGFGEAISSLSSEILMIQALGSYEGAKAFIEKYGEMGEDVKTSLAGLGGIPVDIYPVYSIEEKFTPGS